MTLAVTEFARYGHGLVPVPCPKNCRYPWSVSGAAMTGRIGAGVGLTVKGRQDHPQHRDDEEHADHPSEETKQGVAGPPFATWPSVGDRGGTLRYCGGHQVFSSRSSPDTVRSASVATINEPTTTTTPCAEAKP